MKELNDKMVLDIVKATLWLLDSQIDAKVLAADVKRRVEFGWERDASDADAQFVRCPCCSNGNGACGCFCS